jgi:RNA polymerase sigma factor (sigma-70 family)
MNMTKDTAALLSEVEAMIRGFASKLVRASGGAVDAADLAQVGRIAALRAAASYDPQGGASFRTYCFHPVGEEMRREARRSRSSAVRCTGSVVRDVSLSAPVGEDSEQTLGDTFSDGAPSTEDQFAAAEVEAKVRAIVARVKGEQFKACEALFDELLERLMTSYFADKGERMRCEGPSLRSLAEKYSLSHEWVRKTEVRISDALRVALTQVVEA